jgi:hypothetical protein
MGCDRRQAPSGGRVTLGSEPMKTTTCTCSQPVPVERAERKGASWTECARCSRPLPVRLLKSA